jgi:hypothetical protein
MKESLPTDGGIGLCRHAEVIPTAVTKSASRHCIFDDSMSLSLSRNLEEHNVRPAEDYRDIAEEAMEVGETVAGIKRAG